MDKETLSNYGWIVICVMVLAVMIALATPFGSFISVAVKNTTSGLFDVEQKALTSTGLISIPDQNFEGEAYQKPDNKFAIMNYYEMMVSCNHFDDEGGLASHCIAKYEDAGHSIEAFQTWSENLNFIYEYLPEITDEHMHCDIFAFEYAYENGMTWADFLASSTNNGDFACDAEGYIYCNMPGINYKHYVGNNNSTRIHTSDVINKDTFYSIGFWDAE